jgi:acyl carrier protein
MTEPRLTSTEFELVAFLESIAADPSAQFRPETEIFSPGMFDSLALVSLVEWAEKKSGRSIDASIVDFQKEWKTIAGVAAFVDNQSTNHPA